MQTEFILFKWTNFAGVLVRDKNKRVQLQGGGGGANLLFGQISPKTA